MENQMTTLDKLKKIEVEILDEIDRICEKHGLKYYLAYGTLIGAIRHKGFIPWDDDIDLWMLREDYEKFAEIAPKELGEKFFYQDWHTEPDYPYNFAKVRMNGTSFNEDLTEHLNIHQGVWIDLFPIDKENPDATDEEILKFHDKATRIRTFIEAPAMYKNQSNPVKKIILFILFKLISRKKLHEKLYKLETEFNNTDSEIYSFRMDDCVARFRLSDFGDGIKVDFEGKQYYAPINYDSMLRNQYGDYMQMPPVEKRISNHNSKNIDLGKYN